jgi:hypothetical protein
MLPVTSTAVDETIELARTTLKAYKIGISQKLKADELYVMATAYGKAINQLQEMTNWDMAKISLVVVNGLD